MNNTNTNELSEREKQITALANEIDPKNSSAKLSQAILKAERLSKISNYKQPKK
jgi:hypothetical protein